jgi:IS605 OrfB family transposase
MAQANIQAKQIGTSMRLVEQHILTSDDSRFKAVDLAAFAAKNLYNAANYLVRQSLIKENQYLNYYDVHAQIKSHQAYQALPRTVSQQVLRMLDQNWQSFFAALKAYRVDPSRFRKRPGLPRYLDKSHGRYPLVYTIQALSKPALKQGIIIPSGLAISVVTKQTRIILGHRNNQNFVQIPHARFIEMLTYKAELVGIQVILVNESHTSKCSFLDDEPICHHERYAGRRIKRGLFQAADGRTVYNADVNGAYNIIRKAIPGAFGQGKAGVVVHPVGTAPTH